MINERYLKKDKIGEGRSKVFLCEDTEYSNAKIAIKVLSTKADKDEIENFHNEFITLRRLSHPNIIKSFNFGTIVKTNPSEDEITLGSKYFTLEYFDGKSLLNYKSIEDEEILREIIIQVCSVLFYLHQSDYIYYDLKPENILIKEINGDPILKLIDMGFAQKPENQRIDLNSKNANYIKGTAEYIAPELLKKGGHDNRVDLYALGMILYRIVYKKFPFDTKEELKIYKSHLEQDFDFKEVKYSNDLIRVIKKLLEKEPEKRYNNSLEVLFDLKAPIDNKLIKDWTPVKVFVSRRDILNILDTYINDKTSSEIFAINGFEDSGKTALSEAVSFIYNNSVLIRYDKSKTGYQFLKYFLRKVTFNDFIYSNITFETKENIEKLFKNPATELIDELKGIFAKITQETNFILILDDFHNYDNFTLEMIKDILPIFQVNKIKIIVTEDSDYENTSDSFHNVKEINLPPFTDVQVSELIDKSYNNIFPKEELKKIILLYADLLPGSIENFIRDCLQLNIINYKRDRISIDVTDETAQLLKSSHDQIYDVRLSYLSNTGIEAAKTLSLFDLNIDESVLSILLKLDKNKTSIIIEELRDNNILHSSNSGTKLQFTSEGLKKHVYSMIEQKKDNHLIAGKVLLERYPNFDRNELARQFELGEDYDMCYKVLKVEIQDAERMSAYAYKKSILKHLLQMPLNKNKLFEIELELSRVLQDLNESNTCLELNREIIERRC